MTRLCLADPESVYLTSRVKNVSVRQLPLFFWLVLQHNRCVIASNTLTTNPRLVLSKCVFPQINDRKSRSRRTATCLCKCSFLIPGPQLPASWVFQAESGSLHPSSHPGQRTEGFPCSPAVCHSLTCSLIQPVLIHCVTVRVAGVDKDSLCDQTAARIR